MAIMYPSSNIPALIDKLKELEVESGVVENLNKLQRASENIGALLRDAEEMEIHDESTKLWLDELNQVYNLKECLVDELEYEIVRAKVEKQQTDDVNLVRHDYVQDDDDLTEDCIPRRYTYLSSFLADIIADRVQKINETLDEIYKFRSNFKLTSEDGNRRPDHRPKYPLPTTHMVNTSQVYGREEDKKKIVDLLISNSSTNNFSVLSIIGKGGIGKTTVAQLVYNDPVVSEFFDLKIWICVSLEFDIIKLMREMVEAIQLPGVSTYNSSQLSSLQNVMLTKIKGKKVLLVLDDVWTLYRSLWDSFKIPLDNDKQLVRIIVTTRNEEILSILNSTRLHRVDYLSDNACWELLKSQAFRGQTSEQFAHLEDIGRKIVRKSGGLPLVVKSLGGILQYSTDEVRWNDVLESKLWDSKGENEILPILQLSYNYLPTYLKPCFLSCTVFPKDYRLKKVEVVQLWIALGCIQSKSQSLEDLGNDYFDELQKRSLLDRDRRYTTTFRMHDCIHDLAQHISYNSCSASSNICVPNSKSIINLRALVSNSSKDDLSVHLMTKIKHLRFVVLNYIWKWPNDLYYLYNLRVLVVDTDITKLPKHIVNLINLIYLRVRLKILTGSICQLYNLVTLDLSFSRHNTLYLPTGFGKLSKLEKLYLNALVDTNGISELNNLVNLQGTLCINNITSMDVEDAKKVNLRNKPKVEDLKFYWHYLDTDCGLDYSHLHLNVCSKYNHLVKINNTKKKGEYVLKNLQPHTNVRSLIIEGYDGAEFPGWLGDPSFTILTKLQLIRCREASFLPPLGQLPLLTYLKIEGFSNVKCIGSEFLRNLPYDCGLSEEVKVAFPSLLKLEFYNMRRWEEWRGLQDQDFPLLQELVVVDCSLITLPGLLLKNLVSFKLSTRMHIETVGEIKFLKNLVELPIELYISGLRNILNAEDAEEANIKIKHQLKILTLDFGLKNISNTKEHMDEKIIDMCGLCLNVCSHNSNYIPVDEVDNIQAVVLASLEPHTNLRNLQIYGYAGVLFPHWLGDPSFTNLTQLIIFDCDNVINLPTLGQLPCLYSIIVQKMPHIKNIGPEFCRLGTDLNDGDVAFPSLIILQLREMPELEEWSGVLHGDFPRLATLEIVNCPSLTTVPTVPSSVFNLRLSECGSLKSLHLAPCPSNLERVMIQNCREFQLLVGMHNIDRSVVQFYVDKCPRFQFQFSTQNSISGEQHNDTRYFQSNQSATAFYHATMPPPPSPPMWRRPHLRRLLLCLRP